MAKSEPQHANEEEYCTENEDSAMESCDGDDSEEDPTFDILEETQSSLSKLSLKKSKSSTSRVKDLDRKRKIDFEEVEMVELNEVDAKSFENVEKMIKDGQLEKLKIDQCKVYLRKHGLRLTGTKAVLIERIREHLGVINGGGEQKYPASSFVVNCKGDACTGDIVMFEHNVYEMFNIASRSAAGPAIGTRVVAGRIVKESYGAAKQQHTFTIEVLWSKGVKPLPPLHPLLIKGRNLYRLKTLRQKWTDEAERSKVLQEKHLRGSLARSTRETRIQDKKTKMNLKGQRIPPVKNSVANKENQDSVKSNYLQQIVQTQRPQQPIQSTKLPNKVLTENNQNTSTMPHTSQSKPQMNSFPQQLSQTQMPNHPTRVPAQINQQTNINNHVQQYGELHAQTVRSSYVPPRCPVRQMCRFYSQGRHCSYGDRCKFLHEYSRDQSYIPPRSPQRNVIQQHCRSPLRPSYVPPHSPQRNAMQQHCQFYAFGTCYNGANCKFQHVYSRQLPM